MWRFALTLAASAALHAAVLGVCARMLHSNAGKDRSLPEIDLSAVELSFATQPDDIDADTCDIAAAMPENPSSTPPPLPPILPPYFSMPAATPEPPVGDILNPQHDEMPVAPEASANTARETARVDAPPSPQSAFRPVYPRASRRRGEEGTVGLDVTVDAKGGVLSVEVSASSGFPALDAAAVDAIRRAVFAPAMSGGKPVEGHLRLPVVFRLR